MGNRAKDLCEKFDAAVEEVFGRNVDIVVVASALASLFGDYLSRLERPADRPLLISQTVDAIFVVINENHNADLHPAH